MSETVLDRLSREDYDAAVVHNPMREIRRRHHGGVARNDGDAKLEALAKEAFGARG